MSKIEVNTVEPQCGTTLTLGASGDTVTLGSGASQSGFGRTGTVDWVTTVQTSGFTAANGKGYFVNTTSGGITVNLPAGSAGDIVAFKDYANTWDTNNVTVTPNGSDKIGGTNANVTLSTESQSVTLVFIDSTKGWLDVQDSTSNVQAASFIAATGGTVTCSPCGNFKIHKFTGPGTFCVSSAGNPAGSDTVEILAVGAGGGGGGDNGGGGAGGAVGSNPAAPVSAQAYPITIGGGGTGGTSSPSGPGATDGATGTAVTFFGNTIRPGSGGRSSCSPGTIPGTYSNGGGGAGVADAVPGAQGSSRVCGVAHPAISGYTISAGNNGGAGRNNSSPQNPGPGNLAGGGAGAGAAGTDATAPTAGPGGAGVPNNICAGGYSWGGGGGGGTNDGSGGNGGVGGGGGGGSPSSSAPSVGAGGAGLNTGASGVVPTRAGGAGGDNTGGGGGGSGRSSPGAGGNGGSGIVIIKYRFQ